MYGSGNNAHREDWSAAWTPSQQYSSSYADPNAWRSAPPPSDYWRYAPPSAAPQPYGQYDQYPNEPDHKRRKQEESSPVRSSKVVHMRNLPHEQVSDHEVLRLTNPFGEVHRIMFIPGSGSKQKQALVEMKTLRDAEDMVAYYQSHQAYIQ